MLTRSMLMMFVLTLESGVFLTLQGESRQRPNLQSTITARLEGKVSAKAGMIPLEVTFTDAEQTITNGDYQFVLLNAEGAPIPDALIVTTELRTVVLKSHSAKDSPGVFFSESKIKAGEEYCLEVSVHNFRSSLKFKAVD